MAKKKVKGGLFGLGEAEYEQVDSFPRTVKKGEMLVHEKKCEKTIKYFSWNLDSEGNQKFTVNEVDT